MKNIERQIRMDDLKKVASLIAKDSKVTSSNSYHLAKYVWGLWWIERNLQIKEESENG